MTRASHRVAVPVAGGDLTVGVWDADTYTVVIHNPARGMAVLGDW